MKTSNSLSRAAFLTRALAFLGCALFGTTAEGQPSASQAALTVTLLVYSGRPDPWFEVTDAREVEAVRARLKAAPAPAQPPKGPVIPSILGYRGISVQSPSDLPPQIAVHKGLIELSREKQKSYLVDKDRALERSLLDLALKSKAIDQKLYDAIRATF